MRGLLLTVVILGGLLSGCQNMPATLETLPKIALADPNTFKEGPGAYLKLGTFDIGVGYAVAVDTHTGDDNDASGTLVSLKGYPFGRWYAPPKDKAMKEDTKWDKNANYQVPKMDKWQNRLSVFYGASAGEFSGGGLESTLHAVGLGFDITPEIAIIAGWSFYDKGADTDNGPLFGISLNLYAFQKIFKAIGDL